MRRKIVASSHFTVKPQSLYGKHRRAVRRRWLGQAAQVDVSFMTRRCAGETIRVQYACVGFLKHIGLFIAGKFFGGLPVVFLGEV